MRPLVTAFLLGFVGAGVVAVAAAFGAAFLVEFGTARVVDVSLGGLLLLRATTSDAGAETTLGGGIALVAAAGGAANAFVAAVLASRRR